MHFGTAAAAGAGLTGGSAAWLFSYNKENFGFDAGMRFGRFTTARANLNAQVGQYREDIAGITGVTISKMDAWNTITTCFIAVGAALSCAGRVGMHGSAPPGWLCALFSGNIFLSVMFNGVSLWLSMHASLRAQCAATSLLTRKVRLPIPTMGQMDQARVFGSSFERQKARDVFRVPFMRHPHDVPAVPTLDEKKKKGVKKGAHDPHKEFMSTSRDTVPSWIRDEVVIEKGEGFMGTGNKPVHDLTETPEHFKILMKAQEGWRDYDVYARITMLYGVVSFLYAVTYYCIATSCAELRGFWVMWTLPLVLMTAQVLVLRIDILRDGQHRLPNVEFIGHLAPFIACAACTLEYRFFYSEYSVVCAWALAILAFFCHFVMIIRMLDLAWPARSPLQDMPEEPGKQWWPASWKIPRAFSKYLWFITPPTKLEADVAPCLLHEMDDMANHGGGIIYRRNGPVKASGEQVEDEQQHAPNQSKSWLDPISNRSKNLPWQITRFIILAAAFQWLFMMVVTAVEAVLGSESLLKPPGEPPWIRDTKFRHYVPEMVHMSGGSLPSDYRLFAASTANYHMEGDHGKVDSHVDSGADHNEGGHGTGGSHANENHNAGGHENGGHRRLDVPNPADALPSEFFKILPFLAGFADEFRALPSNPVVPPFSTPTQSNNFMAAPTATSRRVQWPALFEPRHLFCGSGAKGKVPVVAITARGVGVKIEFGAPDVEVLTSTNFALHGLSGEWGPVAGGAFADNGLLVVTSKGKLLKCGDNSVDDVLWHCKAASVPPLPVHAGAELVAAAVSHHGDGSMGTLSDEPAAALSFRNMRRVVMLFRLSQGAWRAAGEVHVPPGLANLQSLHFDGRHLVLTGPNGEVHRRHTAGGSSAFYGAPSAAGPESREYRSSCVLPEGDLVRLALKRADSMGGVSWGPELLSS